VEGGQGVGDGEWLAEEGLEYPRGLLKIEVDHELALE
jgi:hypothetical protein